MAPPRGPERDPSPLAAGDSFRVVVLAVDFEQVVPGQPESVSARLGNSTRSVQAGMPERTNIRPTCRRQKTTNDGERRPRWPRSVVVARLLALVASSANKIKGTCAQPCCGASDYSRRRLTS
jgi:hypothetical protein